ncbi:hypothetical protein B0H34DRAFT_336179 [Crassisporium funariophilum]|nr:hypothetical protein B0H34DRAFT_336179 [Crassisporium funariophilum]
MYQSGGRLGIIIISFSIIDLDYHPASQIRSFQSDVWNRTAPALHTIPIFHPFAPHPPVFPIRSILSNEPARFPYWDGADEPGRVIARSSSSHLFPHAGRLPRCCNDSSVSHVICDQMTSAIPRGHQTRFIYSCPPPRTYTSSQSQTPAVSPVQRVRSLSLLLGQCLVFSCRCVCAVHVSLGFLSRG